jgi:organic radical activating enzyme
MDDILKCERTEFTITHRCNLKCKLCGAYSPYYSPTPHWSYEELTKSIDKYFEVVDYVGKLTLSGGEPLLHPQLAELLDYLEGYIERIGIVEIITNGTVVPDERTLKSLSASQKVSFIVDNYGPELSKKVPQIADALNSFGIKHVVRKYYGEDAYYNGWIDMSDFSKRNRTEAENERIYKQCIFSERFQRFLIADGRVYICAVCKRCESLGLVDSPDESLDLFDDQLTIAQKREQIRSFFDRKSFASCEYCNGFYDNYERLVPAEQL